MKEIYKVDDVLAALSVFLEKFTMETRTIEPGGYHPDGMFTRKVEYYGTRESFIENFNQFLKKGDIKNG